MVEHHSLQIIRFLCKEELSIRFHGPCIREVGYSIRMSGLDANMINNLAAFLAAAGQSLPFDTNIGIQTVTKKGKFLFHSGFHFFHWLHGRRFLLSDGEGGHRVT